MEFSGTYLIFADRARVWRALNDVKVLKKAIPGCDSIVWNSEAKLDLILRVNLGIIKPKFAGELELRSVKEAKSYILVGRGQGGLLGLARGQAKVELTDHILLEDDFARDFLPLSPMASPDDLSKYPEYATILAFSASGGASEKLMALGHKLVGKSAQRIIDRFMERFSGAMGAPVAPISE